MYEFGIDIIKDLSESLSNQIEDYFNKKDKTQTGVSYVFILFIPKKVKEELINIIYSFKRRFMSIIGFDLNEQCASKE